MIEAREERALSVEEFYEVKGIPEKEREEFEFIAGALMISAKRTMKEAFKIGGYAWHAHKRFEEIKGNWEFEETVKWLESIGIRFARQSIRRFLNIYATYQTGHELNVELPEAYRLVNTQADDLLELPQNKIQILGNIFTALPSDDSTNPKELIRELIRSGKVDIEEFTPELATKFRRKAEESIKAIKKELLEELDKHVGEEKTARARIQELTKQIAEIKKKAREEVTEEYKELLKDKEKEKRTLEDQSEAHERRINKLEEQAQDAATYAETVEKKYEETLREKEALEKAQKEFELERERFDKTTKERNKATSQVYELKEKLKKYTNLDEIQLLITQGFMSIDQGITKLLSLRGYAIEVAQNRLAKYFADEIQRRITSLERIRATLVDTDVRVIECNAEQEDNNEKA